jgi:hypothetical protein
MINSNNKSLKSLLDSKDGLHLTTYINFDGDIVRFRKKLNSLLETAEEHLAPVLSEEDRKAFLSPVRALAFETEILKQIKGNIAIFRKNNFFRYVSLPTDVEETCVVANTFHIKPMLKWAQQDQDFLIVGLTTEGASLYKCSQSEMKKIDTAVYPEFMRRLDPNGRYSTLKEIRKQRLGIQTAMKWLSSWVEDLVKDQETMVFVAGQKDHVAAFVKNFKSSKLYPETIAPFFSEDKVFDVCRSIRALLRLDSRTKHVEALKEFETAQKFNRAKTNIFLIAKAAVKGNIKKLVVAEDLNVFGKLDQLTGGVSLHPLDLDHEDDCLLDDLAQTVLLKGGEVVVAKRNEIPQGRPIIAVLKTQSADLTADNASYNEVAV